MRLALEHQSASAIASLSVWGTRRVKTDNLKGHGVGDSPGTRAAKLAAASTQATAALGLAARFAFLPGPI